MTDDKDVYSYYDNEAAFESDGPAVAPKRRARLSSHLPVRFAPDVLAAAKRFAVMDGVSISTWVRRLVEREVTRRSAPTTQASPGLRWVLDRYPEQAVQTTAEHRADDAQLLAIAP